MITPSQEYPLFHTFCYQIHSVGKITNFIGGSRVTNYKNYDRLMVSIFLTMRLYKMMLAAKKNQINFAHSYQVFTKLRI